MQRSFFSFIALFRSHFRGKHRVLEALSVYVGQSELRFVRVLVRRPDHCSLCTSILFHSILEVLDISVRFVNRAELTLFLLVKLLQIPLL